MKSRHDTSVKAIGNGKVGGYLVVFGDAKTLDLQGEYFTAKTEFNLDWYEIRPALYQHGLDGQLTSSPIGKIHNLKVDDIGIWAEAQLDMHNEYVQAVNKLVDKGVMHWSSGSLAHLVEVEDDGNIKKWPLVEGSLTPTPAEPRRTDIQSIKSAYQDLGLSTDKLNIQSVNTRKDASNEHKGAKADDSSNLIDNQDNEEIKMNEELMAVLESIQSQLAELASAMGASDPEKAAEEVVEEIKAEDEDPEAEKMEGMDDEEKAKALSEKAFALLRGKIEKQNKTANAAKKSLAEQAKKYARNQKADTSHLGGFSMTDPNKAKSTKYNMPHVQIGKPSAPNIGTVLQELYSYKTLGTEMKSQSYQLGSSGGFLLDHAVSNEFIEILRDKLILTQLGADFITMDGQETLTLPKDDTEHTAYWVGEGTEIPESQETVGGIVLYPKPLAARVIVPNKFLANSRINYQSRIEEKVRYRIDRALEYAALFGAGGKTGSNTGVEPAGIATIADITSRSVTKTELGSGNGLKPKLSDIEDMIGRVEDANVEDDGSFGFAISPKAKRFFGNMKDADGNYILRSRASDSIDPNFLSYSYADSNLIPNNQTVGTNSDNTTLFFGNWNDLKIGMSNQVEFFIDPYSRSANLETVIIAHIYADVNIARDEAFEVVTGARV